MASQDEEAQGELSVAGRVSMLEQLAISQTLAILRIAEWMIEQPSADRRMLDGMTGLLGAGHVAIKHFGTKTPEHAQLVQFIEQQGARILERARMLPGADDVRH